MKISTLFHAFSSTFLLTSSHLVPVKGTGSTQGTCGGGYRRNGICADPSLCCSQWGWCGSSPGHCEGAGTCGGGNRGNGICPDPSLCCSQWGWCGRSPDHCGGPEPNPSPPPTPPPTLPTGDGFRCGCSSCTDSILNKNANGHTVESRIDWVKNNRGKTEEDACNLVCAIEFHHICSECSPEECNSGPQLTPQPTPSPSADPTQPPSSEPSPSPSADPTQPPSSKPSPSPTPPPTLPTGDGFRCSCSSCTDSILNKNANGHTVETRIDWVKDNMGKTEEDACNLVCAVEFPHICSECSPEECNSGPQLTPQPTPSPSADPTQPPSSQPIVIPSLSPSSQLMRIRYKDYCVSFSDIVRNNDEAFALVEECVDDDLSQLWYFSESGEIVHAETMTCLQVLDNTADDNLGVAECSNVEQQTWRVQSDGMLYNIFHDKTIGTVDCEVMGGTKLVIQEQSCFPWIFVDSISSDSPSMSPTQMPLYFEGIENAVSIARGEIDFFWEPPTYDGEIVDLEDTTYHIFVAIGVYDFDTALENMTIEELIEVFSADEGNQTLQYHSVDGEEYDFVANTTFHGELHSLLVTAEMSGVHSSNVASTQVYASVTTPREKEGVEVVGIFMPTDNLEILYDGTVLQFLGLLLPEHEALTIDVILSGYTSEAELFFVRVTEVIVSSESEVILLVREAGIEDVYEEIDLEVSFAASRTSTVPLTPESRARHRDLIARMNHRRLFLGGFAKKVWNWGKKVVKKAVTFITDKITGVVSEFVDAIKNLVRGKIEESFKIIDIDEKLDWTTAEEILPNTTSSVAIQASTKFRSDLIFKLSVRPSSLGASAALKVDYGVEAGVKAGWMPSKEIDESWNLWSGQTRDKIFVLGVVPVVISWQPKLNATAEVSVSAERGVAELTIGAKGGTSVEARVDLSSGVSTKFNAPTLMPYHKFDIGTTKLSLGSAIGLNLYTDVKLYKGLLETTAGVKIGIGMKSEAELKPIGNTHVPALNEFEISIDFAVPLSVGSLFVKGDAFYTTDLFEKSWPIINLPKAELSLEDGHFCELGASSGGLNKALIKGVTVKQVSKDSDGFIKNGLKGDAKWYLDGALNDWNIENKKSREMTLSRSISNPSSSLPDGEIYAAVKPKFPPLPLPVLYSKKIDDLVNEDNVQCFRGSPCSSSFFDLLSSDYSSVFNSKVFLSQPPDPNAPMVPSSVYKFDDFAAAMKKLQGKEKFEMWLGDECSADSAKIAKVNIAAFLGQSMVETIQYDACDENNWDLWRADIFKEPTSPPETLPALYPMSSSCGQLGQKYADYDCEDACPRDLTMEIMGNTNAGWIGAPPPLFCGPKAKYDKLGYWNPQQFCQGESNTCEGQPFYYPGQTAGVHVPASEDDRFPDFFYSNPLEDANGNKPPPRDKNSMPATNVEGCCWWGRGVIQTTGRCNFGRLNKNLGAGAKKDALYPDINFCKNPQALCDGPSELKWIAGIFFWVSEVQSYGQESCKNNPNSSLCKQNSYKKQVERFVEMGCADDPTSEECDFLFEYASGVVNRGCPFPGDEGCPGCIPGSTCDPAHNVPERIAASKKALRALLSLDLGEGPEVGGPKGTCGNGDRGNGVCADSTLCCSEFGWCGSGPEFCGTGGGGSGGIGGTCGNGDRGNGVCADSTLCCSEFGWCGSESDFCGTGGGGGGGGGGTCGNGDRGNGVCDDPDLCCSEFGWCGSGPEFCGKRN